MVASLSPAAGPSAAAAPARSSAAPTTASAKAPASAAARSSTAGAASDSTAAPATHATHAAAALCAHVTGGGAGAAHRLVGAGQRLGVGRAAAPGRVHDQLGQGDADLVAGLVGLADGDGDFP